MKATMQKADEMYSGGIVVSRISEGTVIDHVDHGRALLVLGILGLNEHPSNTIIFAMNVPSRKMVLKDIVKINDRFLDQEESDKIAIISPRASVNTISNFQVVEKRHVEIPKSISGKYHCPNSHCPSNVQNGKVPTFMVIGRYPIQVCCQYCGKTYDPVDIL